MSEAPTQTPPAPKPKKKKKAPDFGRQFLVSAAPHLRVGLSTRRIMFEVVGAMTPMFVVALYAFRLQALLITVAVVVACLLTEAIANRMRGRGQESLADGSAIVTGVILAFSLPPGLHLYMAFIGGVVAIALAKAIFGGLGQNLFNPAMVGRAFLMICFPAAMGAWLEPQTLARIGDASIDGVTMATPLAAAIDPALSPPPLSALFFGGVGGSIGETSALAALLGGLYLVIRGVADWRQPLGVLLAASVFAFAATAGGFGDRLEGVAFHLCSGAMMFGAFFIATDYVGSPITPIGRLIFGFGVGVLVMIIRLYGAYPEGFMFAILIMNSLTPLIERWTRPTPFGGHVAT
ncbi:MAG: RnfABCDGE type electron transport complex subunit D [Planctomycetota bacterium]|nr:MAG: RnfABCDGE type electron transport complex subunit D [Planctomycetota bacterium]